MEKRERERVLKMKHFELTNGHETRLTKTTRSTETGEQCVLFRRDELGSLNVVSVV